jgi:DNA-binding MarR family transcriptional regulator
MARSLSRTDYRSLARFRYALRQFMRGAEEAARHAGLTPAQHQLLLAVKGTEAEGPPSMSELSEALQLRLHSVVELVQRAETAGLVMRVTDTADARRQLVHVTEQGEEKLRSLYAAHRNELRRLRRQLLESLEGLDDE